MTTQPNSCQRDYGIEDVSTWPKWDNTAGDRPSLGQSMTNALDANIILRRFNKRKFPYLFPR